VKGSSGQVSAGIPAVTGEYMDFGDMLGDAFTYSREGVFGNTNRWLKLILALLCLGLPFSGYIMRVYRGATPAPDVDQWGTLFVDGLKLLAVGLVYAIPVMILWALIYGPFFLALAGGTMEKSALETWEPNFVLMLVFYIVELAIAVFMPIASIRFARTATFGEAFNFGAIVETIKKIGWLNYIVALILVSIIVSIPIFVLIFGFILVGGVSLFLLKEAGVLVFVGLLALMVLLILVLAPLFGVFQARCMTRIYDSVPPTV
jgi:hypothetical protein